MLNDEDLQTLPLAQARALPAEAYVSADIHTLEQERIFARSWQLLAHAGELSDAGCHVIAEIAGRPIILVRGDDGVLRGFFNVCRHRAGPLATQNGCSRFLQCKYHGWLYRLDGQLQAAPEMQDNAAFSTADIRLESVPVMEWQGLVFAAINRPAVSLEDLLEGVVERVAPTRLDGMQFHSRVSYDIDCNWKVYVDNYLEGYHLPHVHPGLNKLLDYRSYRTELADWHSWQHSPLDAGSGPYGAGQAYYYFVYPNMMLNILPDRLQTNLVVPLEAGRCRVIFDYYYPDLESAEARRVIDEDLQFSDEVQLEDIAICERVQQGLASGSYRPGPLCARREAGLQHFQDLLRRAYAD